MIKFVFTCEHGANNIPPEYKYLFKAQGSLLKTHRGYDIGILEVFKRFTSFFKSPNYYSEISRLLIELNRSPHHKNLFSEITKQLDERSKSELIRKYYLPYRNEVENTVSAFIKKNHFVVHISFHSFTPVYKDETRNTDIGLLYDPKSFPELRFCVNWKKELKKIDPALKVRFNYPYLGTADGFTSYLRKKFGYSSYCGIELEINQRLLSTNSEKNKVSGLIINSFPAGIKEL